MADSFYVAPEGNNDRRSYAGISKGMSKSEQDGRGGSGSKRECT
jgi:hypothetical protein